MKRLPIAFRIVILSLIAASSSFAADMQWETARSSDRFVDSIGVCTHWSYRDLAYGTSFDAVEKRLAESGIRYMRDGWDPHLVNLWHDLGVRVELLSEPNMGPLDQQMQCWRDNLPLIADIEGPNEPNLFWQRSNQRYNDIPYPQGVRLWQDDLYKAVRSHPEFADLGVVAPSPIFNGPYELAPINSFDYLTMHPYAGGGMPSDSIAWNNRTGRTAEALLGVNGEVKPLVVSESGYHYALRGTNTLGGAQGGITEATGGKYFPRHFAEFFNAGVVRTYTYELLDERLNPADPEANFGLIRFDLSPKPAFTAMSNLIALLGEAHFDKDKLQWIGPATPDRAIQLGIDGPATVHHTTLVRADGTIDLLIWNEVSSYDRDSQKDLTVAPVPVTVTLAAPAEEALYDPLASQSAQQTFDASTTFKLNVPDQVLLLRLKGATPAVLAGSPPAVPANLTVSATTPTSATMQWKSGDSAIVAFIVNRPGRLPLTILPAADGTATYTDSELTPGLIFPYSVRAVASTGALSEPSSVKAKTPNDRPDLIVKRITFDPSAPKAGDEVHFSAVIANIGAAPTPQVAHGVAFSVNGQVVCWSDTYHDPLPVGGEVTVVSNNGPASKGTWTCPGGTFRIEALVDDVNRIDESNKQNNSAATNLSTGVGPELQVTDVRTEEPAVVGQPAILIGTVKNIGSDSTPPDVIVSCTFLLANDGGDPKAIGYGVYRSPLKPGESVDIKLAHPWQPAQSGTAKIIAIVDDIHRIAQLDDSKNRSEPVDIQVK